MEYKITGYQPEKLFHFFEEISAVPRGSYHEEKISAYLVQFAKERGLDVVQDKWYNVVIKKPGSQGKEDAPPVMLQGHMDMVCEKRSGVEHDFETQGLDLIVDGNFLSANGTTLGADDGAAVAMMLTALDDDTLVHPPLECVFTVQEEVGLTGARNLDKSILNARTMINLDSEEEGVATVSCAGGARVELSRPIERFMLAGTKITVTLGGLKGGHSGQDIDKERANADLLTARLVEPLLRRGNVFLADFSGGSKDNAIARECTAVLLVSDGAGAGKGTVTAVFDKARAAADETQAEPAGAQTASDKEQSMAEETSTAEAAGVQKGAVSNAAAGKKHESCVNDNTAAWAFNKLQNMAEVIRAELASADPGFTCRIAAEENTQAEVIESRAAKALVQALRLAPNGVLKKNVNDDFVMVSSNVGVVRTDESREVIVFSPRSCVSSLQEETKERLKLLAETFDFDVYISGEYPGWDYVEDSSIRRVFQETYRELFGKELTAEAIHAGLECGLFCDALPGLDAIALGPQMDDIHTPDERLHLDSFARYWRLLAAVLAEL